MNTLRVIFSQSNLRKEAVKLRLMCLRWLLVSDQDRHDMFQAKPSETAPSCDGWKTLPEAQMPVHHLLSNLHVRHRGNVAHLPRSTATVGCPFASSSSIIAT